MKLYLDDGKKFADGNAKTIKLPKADQYQLQARSLQPGDSRRRGVRLRRR